MREEEGRERGRERETHFDGTPEYAQLSSLVLRFAALAHERKGFMRTRDVTCSCSSRVPRVCSYLSCNTTAWKGGSSLPQDASSIALCPFRSGEWVLPWRNVMQSGPCTCNTPRLGKTAHESRCNCCPAVGVWKHLPICSLT